MFEYNMRHFPDDLKGKYQESLDWRSDHKMCLE